MCKIIRMYEIVETNSEWNKEIILHVYYYFLIISINS